MSYTLEFSANALEDLEKHKKTGDQPVLKKIQRLLNELREHPATGTGQSEKLKHNFTGLYSIKEEIVEVYVLSAWSHYGDK